MCLCSMCTYICLTAVTGRSLSNICSRLKPKAEYFFISSHLNLAKQTLTGERNIEIDSLAGCVCMSVCVWGCISVCMHVACVCMYAFVLRVLCVLCVCVCVRVCVCVCVCVCVWVHLQGGHYHIYLWESGLISGEKSLHQQVGEIGLDRVDRAHRRGVEKANEEEGFVEGKVGGRKGPRLFF